MNKLILVTVLIVISLLLICKGFNKEILFKEKVLYPYCELGENMMPKVMVYSDQDFVLNKEEDFKFLLDKGRKLLDKVCEIGKTSSIKDVCRDKSKLNETYNQCAKIPSIDFAKEMILGMYSASGCNPKNSITKVTKNDLSKTITFSIQYKGEHKEGLKCVTEENFHLVVIPKIPEDYEIIFKSTLNSLEGNKKVYLQQDRKWLIRNWHGKIIKEWSGNHSEIADEDLR